MNLKNTLKIIITMVLPFLKSLIKSKVVPVLKRKAYEHLDTVSTNMIESLLELKEKIDKTENETKKEAHLEGFKLGVATLKAIGEKLVKSAEELEKAI